MSNQQHDGDKTPAAASSGGTAGCWDATASGQLSGSAEPPSGGTELAVEVTPPAPGNITFLLPDHVYPRGNDAGSQGDSKSKKRGQIGTGLRRYSIRVREKLESKGRTTCKELADEIVAEFSDPSNSLTSPDQQHNNGKNIRRRVYDAVNVLMAVDIVAKDKQEIQWKGLPDTSQDDLKSDLHCIKIVIEKKAEHLQELEKQFIGLQNLIQHNQQLYSAENAPSEGLALPFVLVQTRPHATIEVEISEDMQLVYFDFNGTQFELHDDFYVLKAMQLCERPQSNEPPQSFSDYRGTGTSIPDNVYQPQQAFHPVESTDAASHPPQLSSSHLQNPQGDSQA